MADSIPVRSKDPNDNMIFFLDWTQFLSKAADTISSAVWSIDTNTLSSPLVLGTGAQAPFLSGSSLLSNVWVSGGLIGRAYVIHCNMTSVAGTVKRQSLRIKIAGT